jgi:hypothetical protein
VMAQINYELRGGRPSFYSCRRVEFLSPFSTGDGGQGRLLSLGYRKVSFGVEGRSVELTTYLWIRDNERLEMCWQ